MPRSSIQVIKAVVFILLALATTLLMAETGTLHSSSPTRWIPPTLLACGGYFIWTARVQTAQDRDRSDR